MKYDKIIMKKSWILIVIAMVVVTSCQKKFDPNSYKPAQSFGGFTASNQIASTNLVTHFSFEGGLVDSVSKTSATGFGTSFGTGIKGQALSVGLNNYALFAPTPGIKGLQDMTISYWVNTPMNSAGIQTPVSFVNPTQFWGNLDMFFDGQTASSSVFKIHVWENGGTAEAWMAGWSLASPWSSWRQIVLTYSASTGNFTFYVNGTLIGNSVQAGWGKLNFANVPNIVFGTIQFMTNPSQTTGSGTQPWASYLLGSIDEFRMYNTVLSGGDVRALYQLENLGK